MKTLKELAQDAFQVQDACNLSGVVLGFSRTITDLRAALTKDGRGPNTDDLNTHPICMLWADKIAHLTGTQNNEISKLSEAYDAVAQLAINGQMTEE